jgi:glycosyltransferase involved in cell wall biosynthesis
MSEKLDTTWEVSSAAALPGKMPWRSDSSRHARCGLSVVIPVYNSEQCLPLLVERLESVLCIRGEPFELILVNDGSQDLSWEVIGALTEQRPWVRGINLMRNYGQHNALLCGIRAARHEIIATLDDDLQNPPEELPRLLAKLDEGHDVVYGAPDREQHGLWRDLASRLTKLALKSAMGAQTARSVSAFRVFRARTREAFASYTGSSFSIDVLLTWGTTRFAAIPVRHEPRRLGRSHYTFRKLLIHALNMATGFSSLPLQLASFIGFGFTGFGLLVLAFVVGRYLIQGAPVPGFPFLASIVALFSGAQLFALGIMGEYLARMHSRMMEQPSYMVRESTAEQLRTE